MYVIYKVEEITRRVTGIILESKSFEKERILGILMKAIVEGEQITVTDKAGNFVGEFAFGDNQ